MAFCTNCGKKLEAGSKFCPSCGHAVRNKDDISNSIGNNTSKMTVKNDNKLVNESPESMITNEKVLISQNSVVAGHNSSVNTKETVLQDDGVGNDCLTIKENGKTKQEGIPTRIETNTPSTGKTVNNGNNNFMTNIKHKYFTTEGRLNRKPYFLRGLLVGILASIGVEVIVAGWPVVIACIVASFSLMIRRCHDLNMSGWWSLVSWIPVANIFFGLYLTFAKGTTGSNTYGADPLQYTEN